MASARRRLIIGFTVPSIVIAALMQTTAAQASPTITVSSPPAGQPLYDLRPTITVAYTSDDPVAPLNLATLRVTVNGFDWTAKFTTGPDSATYAVTVDDELIAGVLTIAASISDTAGASASAAANYDVFPTFSALAPSTAEAGDTISLMASGLDPVAGRNKALLTPNGLTAALSDVDRSIGTGRFTLPAGTTTGDVGLEVNGKVARERIRLSVPSVVPNCGGIRSLFATADGGWLVAYGADFFKPVDPQCPPAQLVDFLKWRFVKVTPAGELLPLPVPAGNGLGFDVRIIPDRRRSDAAILKRNFSLPVVVRYKDVDTFLPGWVYAADFDRDGNLFVVFYNGGFRIYRVSKEALAQGGDATLEPIAQLPVQFGGLEPYGFVVSCDGFAYAVVNLQLNNYPWVQPRIFKVDLAARAVVGDRLLGVGEELHNLALSCQTNELWSARFLNVQENTSAAIARTEVTPNGFGISEDVFVTAAAAFPIGVAVGVGGTVYFETGTNAILAKRGAINACPVPTGALPVCETPKAIVILPSTTRWKPQRDNAKNIDVVFKGPKGLKPATILEIKRPDGIVLADQTVAFEVVDGQSDPATYKLTWGGPWPDKPPYLPAGDYMFVVKGVASDDKPLDSDPSRPCEGAPATDPPCSKISLVEVTKIELLRADGDTRPETLSDNPAVPSVEGQRPPQGRPAEGKRIFAEALSVSGTIFNRVKVRATVEPAVTDLRGQEQIRVFFQPIDVDDPASRDPETGLLNLADADGDIVPRDALKVQDNRGSPKEGKIMASPVDVTLGETMAVTEFEVSLQPGDNYRVGASTTQNWARRLKGYQPSTVGEVRYDDGTTTGRVLTEDEKNSVLSDMLTVWRTLHLALDSMRTEPTSSTARQRNFIKGSISQIGEVTHLPGGGTVATQIDLMPDETVPMVILDDGSPNLDDVGIEAANGRFERGTLWIGSGPEAIKVALLDGNGASYVRKAAGIQIPFVLRNDHGNSVSLKGSPSSNPTVTGWDSASRRFTLSTEVAPPVNDGTLTIGGVSWSVVKAAGPFVDVRESQALPFMIRDDDSSSLPFQLSSSFLSGDGDDRDKPSRNIFAQAYVHVIADLPAANSAPFARNIPLSTDHVAAKIQLDAGRQPIEPLITWRSTYWTAYVQAAFQSDSFQIVASQPPAVAADGDPDLEHDLGGTVFGETPGLNESFGSLIYVEAMRDVAATRPVLCGSLEEVMSETVPHEVGHQFGLTHPPPSTSIMSQGCKLPHYFSAFALGEIRWKGVQR